MPPVARKKKKKKAETIAAQQLVVLAPVPFRLSLLEAPWRKRAHRAARLRVTPHPARSAPCTSKMTRRLLQLLPAADPVHVRRLRKLLRRRKLDNPLHQRARFHQWTKRLADSLHSATNGSLCEQDYRELFACVSDCWARVHPGPWTRPLTSHACTIECPFIVHRETYVCAMSSFVHQCTQYTCEYAVDESHDRVCPITSKSYPSHFQYTFEQTGHLEGSHVRDTHVTANAKPKRDHLSIHVPIAAAAAAGPRTPRAVAPKPVADMVFEVESFVSRFLDPAKLALPHDSGPFTPAQRAALAHEIYTVWLNIQATRVPMPSTYTLKAHTLTIMYATAMNVMAVGEVVFAHFHPELVGRLFDLKDSVKTEMGLVFKSHTAWTSFIGTAMAAHCRPLIPRISSNSNPYITKF